MNISPANAENNLMIDYTKPNDIFADMQSIIEISQKTAYQTVNTLLVQRNWLIGYRISAEEISENNRAEYGTKVIAELSAELTQKYGKGFTKTNLYSFYSFYKKYPQIFHTACGKSQMLLSWSHYRTLLQVEDEAARE